MKIDIKKTSIKRCPFCGSEVQASNGVILQLPMLMFFCTNKECGALVSFDNEKANKEPEKALNLWNARAGEGNDEL